MLIKKNRIPYKDSLGELDNILYETIEVKIILENNGIYGFEIQNKVFTNDLFEAVSYLIRVAKLENEEFWNYAITDEMLEYVTPMNAIYWLSGGDEFWENWDINWSENFDLYSKEFESELQDLYDAKHLKDIRKVLKKSFNLDRFFEFALKNNIKESL